MSEQPSGYPVGQSEFYSHVLDPNQMSDEATEFSWGLGLTPKGLENALPSQGGRYHGKAPEPDPIVYVDNDLRM